MRMSLDIPLQEEGLRGRPPRKGGAFTDRPRPLKQNAKSTRFADDTMVERTKHRGLADGVQTAASVVALPHVPSDQQVPLPPWFRAPRGPGGQLTSEQSLNRIVRRETVSRERTGKREWDKASWNAFADRQKSVLCGGHEPVNFAVYHSRWATQQQPWLLPKISPNASQAPRTRTNSSQLFRNHDPVDDWTLNVPGSLVRPSSVAGKRRNVELVTENSSSQKVDKLGLPVMIPQKPQRPKSPPSTMPRPASGWLDRPNTMSRIARRVEMQRKRDMPEPAPPVSKDDEQVDASQVMERLVAVAATGRDDLLESQVLNVLDSCAELCRKGQYPDAERLYQTVLQYSPQNATALCNLGIIVEQVHDNPAHAAQLYNHALQASGDQDITCLIHLARVTYRITNNIAKPRGLLQRVLAIDPTHSAALSNMALLLLSEWVRSNKQLERLSECDPSLPNAGALLLERTGSGNVKRTGSGVWGSGTLERTHSPPENNSKQNAKQDKPGKGAGWLTKIQNATSNPKLKNRFADASRKDRFARITQDSSAAVANDNDEEGDNATKAKMKEEGLSEESDPQATLKRLESTDLRTKTAASVHEVVAEAVNAATEAVKLAEQFFWKAYDSAEQQGDRVSMALALGNIATIHKLVFQDVEKAQDIYKRAIKCDPRHPILRRNHARLYHDLFDEKVEALTAVVRGKASKVSVAKGKSHNTAAHLGGIAEAGYRAALDLCVSSSGKSNVSKHLMNRELHVDLCLNLAGLLCQDAMGNRWAEARVFYKMAHDFDESSLEAAMGYASIMWERESRLNEAQEIIRKALSLRAQGAVNQKRWNSMRNLVGGRGIMSKLLSLKADRIQVEEKQFTSSLMHDSNYMNLAHFEAKNWEVKASSVYNNLEKFGAGSVFDLDPEREWATAGPERNVGEWVYVKYSVPYIVSMVKLKQRDIFAQMVRKLGIYFDNGESREWLLLPEPEEQEITFNPPILSRVVRFEIMQVYGEAITGLNTLQVFGQHQSAADLTLKYDVAGNNSDL
jgi:tetratricopeptide (TPR) repeat protein